MHGFKLYPAGATTNSDSGVTRIENVHGVLERMSELGLVFQVHGEVTHNDVDVFDREARFIDEVLAPIVDRAFEAAHGVRAHHHEAGRAVREERSRGQSARRSRRNTCFTTGTRSFRAASGRITTACRC